ncbi:hypothetical protein BCJMU51_3424 [Bacillus cereus]|nr:hypothetical protein BCM0045_3396 [Bacillus cereus]BCC01342.1 hypothetical protein BCM0057_3424 [Bacillus cereus]BCC24852.1 hypothetical protein BCM0079_3445 [Bacillus cereus]BCC36426.1 hypothetical protein BCM0105_3416 [Bacillus cereus]BCC42228.1 hypothetical protein BCJMU01_3395 [Bacillus cereus]
MPYFLPKNVYTYFYTSSIYRSFLRIYQRFSNYIDDSTENIELPANNDNKKGMQR